MANEEDRTGFEVRRNPDGTLDEVVAHDCFFHLAQMSDDRWWLVVEKDGRQLHVNLMTKRQGKIVAEANE